MKMKKLLALLLALIMALGCAAASAETVYTKIAVNHDAAKALMAGFGMPEDQMGMVDPILAIVDALGIKVITVEDGAQIDLDFNGADALSLGCAMDGENITLASTLFPSYVLTMKTETIGQMMQSFMPGMAGGESGAGGMDMTAVMEPLMGYFTRFMEACSAAAVPGEPVPGAYEFEGVKFDTLVPITVNVPAIAEATKTLMDEILADEAVMGMLQGMAQGGAPFDAEEMKKGFEEWMAHFPDSVTAEYYSSSDGSPAFYIQGESAYEGKEEASFGYTMLFQDGQNMNMKYWDKENQMSGAFTITNNSMRMEFIMPGMSFAMDMTVDEGEPTTIVIRLYFMDLENALVTVTVTASKDGARTLPMEAGDKTVLTVEDLMADKGELSSGLLSDIMSNGLGGLMGALMQAVPEAAPMLGMLSGAPVAPDSKAIPEGKMPLQLGTSGYFIVIPDSYTYGELTEEDIADDMVAYMLSPDSLLDFDIYQFSKEGYPDTLTEFVMQEAEEYGAFSIGPQMEINGIPAGMYMAKETYEDKEYTTATYAFEDGGQYVEIVFWLDGEEAVNEATEIIYSLFYQAAAEEAEGTNPITGDWAVNYFGIPMYFYFNDDGTYLGLIADEKAAVADDGSNSINGTWIFDGEKMYMYGEEGEAGDVIVFAYDGMTMTGQVEGIPVVFTRAIEPEQAN